MSFLHPRHMEEEYGPFPHVDRKLFDAAKNGDEAVLAARLKAGVPPDHPAGDMERMTPLIYAILGGHHGCMRLLLDAGADIHLMDGNKGRMPLRAAIEMQDEEAVKILLAHGADPGWSCVRTDANNFAISEPVTDEEIARDGNPAILHLVTAARKKFRVNEVAHENPDDLSEMRQLLADGAPVDIKNHNGQTALMYACINRNLEAVKLLLDCGADPNVVWQPHGVTALRSACAAYGKPANPAIVQLLLDHGADPHKLDARGQTMMHSAARSGDENTMKLLAANGVSLTAKTPDGMSPAEAAEEWDLSGANAAILLEKVSDWNAEEIGRKVIQLDQPVKAMKPIRFGKGQG
ncbi:MAG: ankyrin repeat domain-containing protein [Alphaproteobacteria bacterium]